MRCLSFLEKYVVGPCDPGVVVRLYVASTHNNGFMGVVVGVNLTHRDEMQDDVEIQSRREENKVNIAGY